MKYVVCGTILPAEIELLLPGASPAAGKYLRNLMNALGDNGYESVVCSFCAIPGAAEAFEKKGISAEDRARPDKGQIRLYHNRLPAVSGTADDQRPHGVRLCDNPDAVRVLLARGTFPADDHRFEDQAALQPGPGRHGHTAHNVQRQAPSDDAGRQRAQETLRQQALQDYYLARRASV